MAIMFHFEFADFLVLVYLKLSFEWKLFCPQVCDDVTTA